MSGGSFNYAYMRVLDYAEELKRKLDYFDEVDDYGGTPYNFHPSVLKKLRGLEREARTLAAKMREAEWLYSGDTGEEWFMKTIEELESYRPSRDT